GLVGGDGGPPEASVTCDVVGKLVVGTEEDRFAISREDELGRKRPVERPQLFRILVRQPGMEARPEIADPGAFLRDLHADPWRKYAEPLMRPVRPGRTALDWADATTQQSGDGLQGSARVIDRRERPLRRNRAQRMGGEQPPVQDVEARQRLRERPDVEQRARRRPSRDV